MLKLIKDSSSATVAAASETVLPIYYLTVGDRHSLKVKAIESMCSEYEGRIKCIRLNHFDEKGRAAEDVTLRELQGYCRQYPEQRVVYLHSGVAPDQSATWNSRVLRRRSTQAVTSRDCTAPKNRTCNLCSLHTAIWPYVHPL